MMVLPVTVILVALLNNVLAQNGTPDGSLTSTFKGLLAYNLSRVEHPENLTQENWTTVRTDVCKQITHMVPWYRAQENITNCTVVGTDRNGISVNYTILLTEEFLRTHDPLCSTYYILLANLVRRTVPRFEKYYLRDITLENASDHTGSTTIGVDGQLKESGGWVRWAGFILSAKVTSEIQDNVRKQIADFLKLSNISGSNIYTNPFGEYQDPEYKLYTRIKVNITIKNSMLAANRINYTCSSFRQLIKECVGSPFFYSKTIYIGRPVKLLDEKSDRSVSTETAQPETPVQESTTKDSGVTQNTPTQGGGDGKKEESSANTTNNSPTPDQTITNNGSVTTTSRTISGGVGKMTFGYSTLICHMFIVFPLAAWLCDW
ncbi:hypothetical protein P879_03575 [Paragonimus westermani]|uniref:Uncharacterized protein n=1 Tax=Paragonimus westermani TaxID=34504 RepID=A0A8T0DPJ9_9TREM|nr:hypothetical protein P879_03575 [Paragonimus westermani]